MPYVKHKFGKTFFVSAGRGKGLPFVFLHGGPGGRHDFNLPILKLGKDRKVFIYDQIGGGKSTPTAKKFWNIETFVSELETLIGKWGIDRFHLGGGSWGTTLALEYYLRIKKNNIASLTMISPMFSANDWKKDGRRLIARLPQKTRRVINACHEIGATDSKVYHAAVSEFYLKHVLRDKKKLDTLMKKFTSGHGTGAKIYEYMWGPSEFEPTGTLKPYNRVSSLKKIKVPSLFMCGQHDEATPATTARYAKMVTGAEFKILKNCSHVSLIENPKLVLKNIENFLKHSD